MALLLDRGNDLPTRRQLFELEVEYTRFNARRALRPSDTDFAVLGVGATVVMRDANRPDSTTYNRALGFSDAELPQLEEILQFWTVGGARGRFDVDENDEAGVADALAAHGFAPTTQIVYLATTPEHEQASPWIRVRRWPHEEVDSFFDLLDEGADEATPEAIRAKCRDLYCTDTFPAFVGFLQDEVAGSATIFFGTEGAVFANAFTLPRFRKQGVQSALFGARLDAAARRGVRWVITDVEPDTESYRNATRAGFRPVSKRTVWLPEGLQLAKS